MRTLPVRLDAPTPACVEGVVYQLHRYPKDDPYYIPETVMIAGREHFEGNMATARQAWIIAQNRGAWLPPCAPISGQEPTPVFRAYVSPLGELVEVDDHLFPITMSHCHICDRFPAPFREADRRTAEEMASIDAFHAAQRQRREFFHGCLEEGFERILFQLPFRHFCEKHHLSTDVRPT